MNKYYLYFLYLPAFHQYELLMVTLQTASLIGVYAVHLRLYKVKDQYLLFVFKLILDLSYLIA